MNKRRLAAALLGFCLSVPAFAEPSSLVDPQTEKHLGNLGMPDSSHNSYTTNPPVLEGPSAGELPGVTGSRFDPHSLKNRYGRYGSRYSQDSIHYPYGRYGSRYRPQPLTNPYVMPQAAPSLRVPGVD
jgi:hypothetical protein